MATSNDPRIAKVIEGFRPGEPLFSLRLALENFERDYLRNVLVFAEWDIASAADMLGIEPGALQAKVEKYRLRK